VKKYRIISMSLYLLFFVLLFSGFAGKSAYHGIVAIWAVVFSVLIETKLYFIEKPSLILQRKIVYVSVTLLGIFVSIIMILLANVPNFYSHAEKLIVTIATTILILLVAMKLLLQWNKLSNPWRITLIFLACFLAFFALIHLIR
jgi:hypothetical protein